MNHGHADLGAEGILLAGAGRALLLQIANPAVARGVAQHSNFTDRPLHRLMGTLTYVYAVVYGNEEQVKAARRRVNRAHARVRSGPGTGGAGYSAYDPELQLWVAATLYDTAATILTRVYGPLDDETADAMYHKYAELATALQLPARMWPEDRAAFARYWEEHLATLRADDAAVQIGRSLLYPAAAPLWYRTLMPPARFMTAGLLTEQLRADFGLPWNARSERRFQRTMAALAVAYPRLPRWVRHWVKDYCLGALA